MTKNTIKLLTAEELAEELNERLATRFTERSIATMRQARRIPVTRLGYRTCRYDLEACLRALTRNEVKAIGT
jgi:hypothetical protein